jgi:hypothetical protein
MRRMCGRVWMRLRWVCMFVFFWIGLDWIVFFINRGFGLGVGPVSRNVSLVEILPYLSIINHPLLGTCYTFHMQLS